MSDTRKDVYRYPGESLDVTWDERLCIHVGECTRARGGLFESGRTPWGEPDRAPADEVAAVVARCPTGSLVARRHDGGAPERADAENRILVANNGPLYARGELQIDGAADDMPGLGFRAALCRCGRSARKPFCDNSHEQDGFRDRGAIGERGSPLLESGGPLQIRPVPDGPLVVSGNLTLVAGHGERTWQGTKAVLCRCGQSADKPFCDNTHRTIGFQAG
jgi:CDGSH-type Zn-finger protein/uncharacterized Fe-S cluster protein YjdI